MKHAIRRHRSFITLDMETGESLFCDQFTCGECGSPTWIVKQLDASGQFSLECLECDALYVEGVEGVFNDPKTTVADASTSSRGIYGGGD